MSGNLATYSTRHFVAYQICYVQLHHIKRNIIMKKLLILPVLLFTSIATYGQFKVLSSGSAFLESGRSYYLGNENQVQSDDGNRIRLHQSFSNAYLDYWQTLYVRSGPTYSAVRLTLTDYGNLGIGRTPSYKLDVNGTARVGSVTYSSDERMKENIHKLSGDMEKIKKLTPVAYFYKPDAFEEEMSGGNLSHPDSVNAISNTHTTSVDTKKTQRERMGFLAQDFQKVYPELVYEDEKGYLSIDYVSLIPVLVETLQEQQKQIDQLKEYLKKVTRSGAAEDIDNKTESLQEEGFNDSKN